MGEQTSAEQLWRIIADVRDASPRAYNDADTDDIVAAIIAEWAPVQRAEEREELIIELLARREATDQLLGDFFGHPRYQSMTYPEAAVRATAFNVYEDALDVGYGRDIEQRIIDFADEHDAEVTARSTRLVAEARAWHPELKNTNERGTHHG